MDKKYRLAIYLIIVIAGFTLITIGLNGMYRTNEAETKTQLIAKAFCMDRTYELAKNKNFGLNVGDKIDSDLIDSYPEFIKNNKGEISFHIRCDYKKKTYINLQYETQGMITQ